jgi:membrane protease YdiL (CAAX protease family)
LQHDPDTGCRLGSTLHTGYNREIVMKKTVSSLSVGVVILFWIYSLGSQILFPSYTQNVTSVKRLALIVAIKTAVALGVIVPLLRANGERIADLGFTRHDFRRAIGRGMLYAIALLILANVVLSSVIHALGIGSAAPSTVMSQLFHDRREAPYWVFCAIIGGGFTEELIRAFVLTRFSKAFGRWGLVIAVAVDAVQFGGSHSYQGTSVVITTGVGAVLFSLIFLRRRRVADTMVTHALFDLPGILVAYAIYSRHA